jgi:hypothetical protein
VLKFSCKNIIGIYGIFMNCPSSTPCVDVEEAWQVILRMSWGEGKVGGVTDGVRVTCVGVEDGRDR